MSIPAPGAHGGDAAAVAASLGICREEMIDLSMSMNPVAPDVKSLVAGALDRLDVYPDPEAAERTLADVIGVDPDRLVLTNGGAEAIALVAATMPAGQVIEPEFSLYRRHLSEVRDDAPRWRSNPSNPLGRLAGSGDTATVWDEAFYPLATGRWTDPRGDAAWRLGSLTKLWSCPGLRLGYVVAPDVSAARVVRDRQPQWSVNGLALAVVEPLLAVTDLDGWTWKMRRMRASFAQAILALGFDVRETDANWILVDDRTDLRRALAPRGVLVRDCSSFGLPATSRVAVPLPDQLGRVVDAFEQVAIEDRPQ